jgi:hypothetical protein
MLAIVVAGVASYLRLGRSEDPDFTVKTMVVQVGWPGDTLRRVGIDWCPHPNVEEVRREYERIWPLLGPTIQGSHRFAAAEGPGYPGHS